MKRVVAAVLFACMIGFSILGGLCSMTVYARETDVPANGTTYELRGDDQYEIEKAQETDRAAGRFSILGDISEVSEKNGFTSYAVDSGNLRLMLREQFREELLDQEDTTKWHIISDNKNVVNGTQLNQSIGTGAIVVQTSKDGKIWITSDTETDVFNKLDSINNRSVAGEPTGAFYRTTNIQLTNGCYYRIIVAYRLQREIDPTQILFVSMPNREEKEQLEVYQFFAFDTTVNQAETLDSKTAYEFGDVYRVDSQDGFSNPVLIKSNDPHIDWSVGKFYVSGYTDVRRDGDVPVFLKVPGDRAALWFHLEQELDRCNGRTDIKVNYISSGSDIYFGTPTIDDFGRGALIIRKTDSKNQKKRQIYTNYLEASATVGANTRVDLFEEGDYEVALDYQLHYDKPFVFGTTTTKTITYRIFFKFKVRNGDISAFLRDVDTDKFITNANIAEHGFYIDVANSQYLNLSIKREVLTESLDGLVEDTKFSGVAKEGRHYTEEGIYTVTVKNLATGDHLVKRVYVGNRDILLAHMTSGLSISEINEKLAAGASIDALGFLSGPEPSTELSPELSQEPSIREEPSDIPTETNTPAPPTPVPESEQDGSPTLAPERTTAQATEEDAQTDAMGSGFQPGIAVGIAVVAVLLLFLMLRIRKRLGEQATTGKGDE